MFEKYDKDGSGDIDTRELAGVLKAAGYEFSQVCGVVGGSFSQHLTEKSEIHHGHGGLGRVKDAQSR